MQNDEVLHRMPADTKFFIYREVPLAYSPETGMCWKARKGGSWNLVTPGTREEYTVLRIGCNQPKLHRIVAEVFLNGGKPLTSQQVVDHREHADGSHWQDRLDNLRICSSRENSRNQKLKCNNTSGFKSVCWDKPAGKWRANIRLQGKLQHLGYFHTPEAAASAYDTAALQHFGDFALTNEKLGNFKPRKECPCLL